MSAPATLLHHAIILMMPPRFRITHRRQAADVGHWLTARLLIYFPSRYHATPTARDSLGMGTNLSSAITSVTLEGKIYH